MLIYLLCCNDGVECAFEDEQLAKKICKENYDKAKQEAVKEHGYKEAIPNLSWRLREVALIKKREKK